METPVHTEREADTIMLREGRWVELFQNTKLSALVVSQSAEIVRRRGKLALT